VRRGEPRIGETSPVAGGDGKPTLGEIRLYSKLVGRRTDSTPQSASMHCPPQALGAGHRPSRARDQIRIHRLHRNRYRVASREFIKCTAFATASPLLLLRITRSSLAIRPHVGKEILTLISLRNFDQSGHIDAFRSIVVEIILIKIIHIINY
jgi:hypothetical protein